MSVLIMLFTVFHQLKMSFQSTYLYAYAHVKHTRTALINVHFCIGFITALMHSPTASFSLLFS